MSLQNNWYFKMQGALVILVLVSGVGFNPKGLSYSAWSYPLNSKRLNCKVGVEDNSSYYLGMGYSGTGWHATREPTIADYVIEGIGGVIGGCAGWVVGVGIGSLSWYLLEDFLEFTPFFSLSLVPWMAVPVGLVVGSAEGVTFAGRIMGQSGSFLKALRGPFHDSWLRYIDYGLLTYLGIVAGFSGMALWVEPPTPLGLIVALSICVSWPTIRAVWGYNKAEKKKKQSLWGK